MECNERTAVEHEVQFEIPKARVVFFRNPTYKVRIEIGLFKMVLSPITCLGDTYRRQNFINENCIEPQLEYHFMSLVSPELRMKTEGTTNVKGIIPPIVQKAVQ